MQRMAVWIMTAAAACPLAHAGLLDVSFYGTGFSGNYTVPTGAAYVGSAGDQWNAIGVGNPNGTTNTAFGPFTLFDTTGTVTPVQVSFGAEGGVTCGTCNPSVDQNLFNNYLYNNTGGPITLSLTGLVPLASYELVLYVSSTDAQNGNRTLTGMANGVPFGASGNVETSYSPGDNIVPLILAADGSGTISVIENNAGNSDNEVDMNGLQLQGNFVPEPESWGLMLSGALVLLGLRKRRK